MAGGNGTSHHKLGYMTGMVMILSLPLALFGLIGAIPGGANGFLTWIGSPFGAISLLIFLSAAIWYCKLEFDEVIMDYTDGGLRSLGLNLNRLVGFVIWAISVFAILKIWLGA